MLKIKYIDRQTGKEETEDVYGSYFLEFLYGEGWFNFFLGRLCLLLVARCSFLSHLYGYLQKSSRSKKRILPFIQRFGLDSSEFEKPLESFASFNDFFIRKLKPEARKITEGKTLAILPADGKYLFYSNLAQSQSFQVKGKNFSLGKLLNDSDLAKVYVNGSMVIARLAPHDYHRFHFPCDCLPSKAKLINGTLYSVNPFALKRNFSRLSENKRSYTILQTENFGNVLFIEVGATFVASIHQTYRPETPCLKGQEKGYFSLGGSTVILLFEEGTISFDPDLTKASLQGIEIKGRLGQSMGLALKGTA